MPDDEGVSKTPMMPLCSRCRKRRYRTDREMCGRCWWHRLQRRFVICLTCGFLRTHCAHGLCSVCYAQSGRRGRNGRRFCICVQCRRLRQLKARGMCRSCYVEFSANNNKKCCCQCRRYARIHCWGMCNRCRKNAHARLRGVMACSKLIGNRGSGFCGGGLKRCANCGEIAGWRKPCQIRRCKNAFCSRTCMGLYFKGMKNEERKRAV